MSPITLCNNFLTSDVHKYKLYVTNYHGFTFLGKSSRDSGFKFAWTTFLTIELYYKKSNDIVRYTDLKNKSIE